MGGENISYWNQTAEKKKYPPLEKDIETDVLIVGCGITGVTTAYCLTQKGYKPAVIEAGSLCDGTTGNTTGKLTIQHDIIYSNLNDKYGLEFAQKYAESQTKAIDFAKETVRKESIVCQLAENTAYMYASAPNEMDMIEREYEVAKKLGIDAELIHNPNFPVNNIGMLGYENQAVFHPVRYANALAILAAKGGAKIYNDTKAIKVDDGEPITVFCENDIKIKANHLVMATQYPIYDGPNLFFTRLYAKRDYGIAVDAENSWPDGSYINIGEPGRSVRTHVENGKRILIVVGEDHATGREEEEMKYHYDHLIQFARDLAGVKQVLAKWSAQDYDTPDQVPYIGRLSDDSHIYVATGFQKWGLSRGTLSGMMISALIADGNCDYEDIYSRNRHDYSSSLGKVMTGVLTPVGELVRSKFEGTEDFENIKKGEGRIVRYNGQKAGLYRDQNNTVTILDISCTHMTTELNFNQAENTWDCPAHGGRFSTDGKLLEGPPKDNLQVLYRGSYQEFLNIVQ